MKKITSTLSSILIVCFMLAAFSGCTKTDDRIAISIGAWPSEENSSYALYQQYEKDFEEMYPNIDIIPDTSSYSLDTFVAKAASKQLPTMYQTHFTEVDKIVANGFARDITDIADKYGYSHDMNDMLSKLLTKDGRLYGIPKESYAMGLFVNKRLFEQAGLVNEDGTVKFPSTYEELASYAQTIKEKTGKSGFMMSTTNNCGGWHFMNIAWSYGVDFMEEKNGKWVATFNSPECIEALQFVKDLRWKHNVLTSNVFVDGTEIRKLYASGETAMIFLNPPTPSICTNLGMNKDDIAVGRIPAGKEGRYSQIGGSVYMIEPDATDEQVDAVLKWLSFLGVTSDYTDKQIQSWKDNAADVVANGGYILPQEAVPTWDNEERTAAYEEAVSEYVNIDRKDFADYLDFNDVIVQQEEPQNAQQLYAILDACIQEVMTNKDADVEKLIKDANDKFQKDYLDKLEEN